MFSDTIVEPVSVLSVIFKKGDGVVAAEQIGTAVALSWPTAGAAN
jgi:hypothetical protein